MDHDESSFFLKHGAYHERLGIKESFHFELRVANVRPDSLTALFGGMIIIALAVPAIGWKELK